MKTVIFSILIASVLVYCALYYPYQLMYFFEWVFAFIIIEWLWQEVNNKLTTNKQPEKKESY